LKQVLRGAGKRIFPEHNLWLKKEILFYSDL